jgi:creatinine amidohydrolase
MATGGGHASYPWSIMMNSGAELGSQLATVLDRLHVFGIRVSIVFTGHFAPKQLELIDDVAGTWNARGTAMEAVALGINGCDASPAAPDHAGVFETSVLHALWPDRVDISRLPPREQIRAEEAEHDAFGPQRHDPEHPLWGVFGPDPRGFEPRAATGLLDVLVDWLAGLAQARLAGSGH